MLTIKKERNGGKWKGRGGLRYAVADELQYTSAAAHEADLEHRKGRKNSLIKGEPLEVSDRSRQHAG